MSAELICRRPIAEPLCENTAPATGFGAVETANRDAHLNGATVRGQIKKPTFVAAVHLLGRPSAIGTLTSVSAAPDPHEKAIRCNCNLLDQQTSRR